jgi:hypothetical protein
MQIEEFIDCLVEGLMLRLGLYKGATIYMQNSMMDSARDLLVDLDTLNIDLTQPILSYIRMKPYRLVHHQYRQSLIHHHVQAFELLHEFGYTRVISDEIMRQSKDAATCHCACAISVLCLPGMCSSCTSFVTSDVVMQTGRNLFRYLSPGLAFSSYIDFCRTKGSSGNEDDFLLEVGKSFKDTSKVISLRSLCMLSIYGITLERKACPQQMYASVMRLMGFTVAAFKPSMTAATSLCRSFGFGNSHDQGGRRHTSIAPLSSSVIDWIQNSACPENIYMLTGILAIMDKSVFSMLSTIPDMTSNYLSMVSYISIGVMVIEGDYKKHREIANRAWSIPLDEKVVECNYNNLRRIAKRASTESLWETPLGRNVIQCIAKRIPITLTSIVFSPLSRSHIELLQPPKAEVKKSFKREQDTRRHLPPHDTRRHLPPHLYKRR